MSFVCADGCVIRHNPYGGSVWGVVFYGTEGVVAVNRGRLAVWRGAGVAPDAALQARLNEGTFDAMPRVAFWHAPRAGEPPRPANDRSLLDAVNRATKAFGLKKAKAQLYKANGHPSDFVSCVQTRRQPCSSAEVGARASILCNLCNLSYVHDAGFDWDPARNVFANGTGDAAWLTKAYRAPWKLSS